MQDGFLQYARKQSRPLFLMYKMEMADTLFRQIQSLPLDKFLQYTM